jgi:hypothetical protein
VLTIARGQRGNFMFPLPVSGLPLLLLAPRLSPRSFTRKIYKGETGVFTVYQFISPPPPALLLSLRASELLHSPQAAAIVDARKDPCAQEQDGEKQSHQCVDQLGAF